MQDMEARVGASDQAVVRMCQRVSLELLDRLSQVCRDNSLQFHLGGGTLLGAIRHGGFIPWDDDVDVSMPRGDLNQLLALYHNNPDVFGSDVGVFTGIDPIVRICYLKSRTATSAPIALDIIAIEPVPDERWKAQLISVAAYGLRTLISIGYGFPKQSQPRDSLSIRVIRRIAQGVGPARLTAAWEALLELSERASTGATLNALAALRPIGHDRPSTWYAEPRLERFEGRDLPVPTHAESVLEMLYGPHYLVPPSVPSQPHVKPPLSVTIDGEHWVWQ